MADHHVRRLSRLQVITARNMHQAQQQTAHATLHSECDVTALIAALGPQPEGQSVWISPHVVHALTKALAEHPSLNAHLTTDELCIYERIKLGMMLHTGQGVMLACINSSLRSASSWVRALTSAAKRTLCRAPQRRYMPREPSISSVYKA